MNNLTDGRPAKVIIRFMIPVLLGNLLQLTYSIADTRIVGSLLGDTALAGIGAAAALNSLFNGFFMGIANGFAVIMAQAFGEGSFTKVRRIFAVSLVMGGALAAGMITVTVALLGPVLSFLNVPDDLIPVTSGYIRIVLIGMIITMIYDVLLASSRAVGDSVTPLLILILSVVLNIGGDLLLIGVLHTDVRGAAAATVAAQFAALIICAVYLLRKYDFFRIRGKDLGLADGRLVIDMLTTGLSMGLMSSMISIGSLILQTAINDLGNSYIVAQAAARKLTDVLMSVFIAMGQTMATYCGQNYGAWKLRRIREGMRAGYIITCGWCVIVLLVVYLGAPQLVAAITDSSDQVMIEAASRYLKIDCILYFLVAIIFVQRNSLQGIGDRVTPLISSGIEMLGKIVLTYTLVRSAGYTGVIFVEPIVWIVMIIPLIGRWIRILRSEKWQSQ